MFDFQCLLGPALLYNAVVIIRENCKEKAQCIATKGPGDVELGHLRPFFFYYFRYVYFLLDHVQ